VKDKIPYIIIGVLIGVIVMQWQQGPAPAQAQAPEPITGFGSYSAGNGAAAYHHVMLANGDVYRNLSKTSGGDGHFIFRTPPTYVGNFWQGPPVQTNQSTWGAIKALNNTEKKGG